MSIYSMTLLSESLIFDNTDISVPSLPIYFSASNSVLCASSIFAARSPTWTVDQMRFAVDSAMLRVF